MLLIGWGRDLLTLTTLPIKAIRVEWGGGLMRACHCIRSILIVFRLFLLRQICNFSLQTISLKRFECNRRSLDHSLTAHLFFRQIQTLIASWRGKNECFLTHSLSLSLYSYLSAFTLSVSVTRFGKNFATLAKNYKYLSNFFDCLFSIWQNVEPTLANCQCCKLPKNEK